MIRRLFKPIDNYYKSEIYSVDLNHGPIKFYNMDIEKLKSNLTTIDYETFINLIYQEDVSHHDNSTHKMLNAPKDNRTKSKDLNRISEFRIEDDEEEIQIEFEEEYKFILVKKARPNPTVVMPTKLLKQLEDPSLLTEFKELKEKKDKP